MNLYCDMKEQKVERDHLNRFIYIKERKKERNELVKSIRAMSTDRNWCLELHSSTMPEVIHFPSAPQLVKFFTDWRLTQLFILEGMYIVWPVNTMSLNPALHFLFLTVTSLITVKEYRDDEYGIN